MLTTPFCISPAALPSLKPVSLQPVFGLFLFFTHEPRTISFPDDFNGSSSYIPEVKSPHFEKSYCYVKIMVGRYLRLKYRSRELDKVRIFKCMFSVIFLLWCVLL